MRLRLSLLLVLVVIVLYTFVKVSVPVYAANPTGSWVDIGHISFNGKTFTDKQPFDSIHEYKESDHNCVDKISADPGQPSSAIYANLKLSATGECYVIAADGSSHKADPHNGALGVNPDYFCKGCTQTIKLDQTERSMIGAYHYTNTSGSVDTTSVLAYITFGDSQSLKTYKKLPAGDPAATTHPNRYYLEDGGKSNSAVYTELGANNTANIYNLLYQITKGPAVASVKVAPNTLSPSDVAKLTTPPQGSPPATNQQSCESKSGALGWIMCPVLGLLDDGVSKLDKVIKGQLTTPDISNNTDLKGAWGRLRNIALIILVPIMLVMVIGTALGVSFLDAYTVRKAMPRFLIAIVFISTSWYIVVFLITITNVVGEGILGLITQPFGGQSITLSDLINPRTAAAAGATGLVVFGGLVVAGLASFGIILSIAFGAVVALLIGFLVLTIRQVLIFVFLLFAPLAILSWIFPSNDKLWKLWWGTFSKLLLMFPLIMILIGSGKIFASVMNLSGRSDDFFGQILMIVAYVIPYFFIPFTFKFAGGLFGALSGMINDRGRGFFDRQKKYRQEKRATGFQDFKSGSGKGRFRQSGFVRRAGLGVSAGIAGGYGFTKRGKAAMDTRLNAAADEKLKDASFVRATYNDDVRKALMLGSAKAARDAGIDEGSIAAAKAVGFTSATQLGALKAETSNKSRNFKSINEANAMISAIAARTGARESDLRDEYSFAARNAGRWDLGALDPTKSSDEQAIAGWKKGSLYQHANGMEQSYTNIATAFQGKGGKDLAIFQQESKAIGPNATGAVADASNKFLRGEPLVAGAPAFDVDAAVTAYFAGSSATDPNPVVDAGPISQERTIPDPDNPGQTVTVREETGRRIIPKRQATVQREARTYQRPDENNIT